MPHRIRHRIRDLLPILAQGYALVCALGTTFLLARALGVQHYGSFIVLTTLNLFGSEIASGGYTRALARRLPNLIVSGRPAGEVVAAGLLGSLTISIVLTVILIAATAMFSAESADYGPASLPIHAAIPLATLIPVGATVCYSYRRTFLANLPGQYLRPTIFLGAVLLAIVWHKDFAWLADAFFVSYVIAGIAALLTSFPDGFRNAYPTMSMMVVRHTLRRTLLYGRYSWAFWLNGLLVGLRERIVIILFGAIGGASDVSYFAAANRIATTFRTFFNVTRATYQSRFAEFYIKGDRADLEKNYQHSVIQQAFVIIPMMVAFLGTPALTPLLFGRDFDPVYQVAAITFLGIFINVFLASATSVLAMTDQQHWLNRPAVSSLVMTLIGTLILGHYWGAVGAAIASTFGYTTFALATWRRLRQHMPIRIFSAAVTRAVVLCLAMGLAGTFGARILIHAIAIR